MLCAKTVDDDDLVNDQVKMVYPNRFVRCPVCCMAKSSTGRLECFYLLLPRTTPAAGHATVVVSLARLPGLTGIVHLHMVNMHVDICRLSSMAVRKLID